MVSQGGILLVTISKCSISTKKSGQNIGAIPEKLTLRDCVGKASEVFDLTGKIAPITAGLKLDVSILHQRMFEWDEPHPK